MKLMKYDPMAWVVKRAKLKFKKVFFWDTLLDTPARLTISWYLDLLLIVFVKLNQNDHKY